MKTKALLLIALGALAFSSCNPDIKKVTSQVKEEYKAQHEYRDSKKWGKVITKEIKTDDFTALEVQGAVDIVFTQSDTLSVKAYGNEKAIAQYNIIAEAGKLIVSLKGAENEETHINHNTPAITVFVNAPQLENIKSEGAGDIKICDTLEQECGLEINLSGAGDIDAKTLKLGLLCVNINGAGDLYIDDAECTGNAAITLNGAGDVEADLKCANANLTVNGAGDANLKVKCNELTAECNGAGDVKLKGECNKLNKQDGALSAIDSRNLTVKNKVKVEK